MNKENRIVGKSDCLRVLSYAPQFSPDLEQLRRENSAKMARFGIQVRSSQTRTSLGREQSEHSRQSQAQTNSGKGQGQSQGQQDSRGAPLAVSQYFSNRQDFEKIPSKATYEESNSGVFKAEKQADSGAKVSTQKYLQFSRPDVQQKIRSFEIKLERAQNQYSKEGEKRQLAREAISGRSIIVDEPSRKGGQQQSRKNSIDLINHKIKHLLGKEESSIQRSIFVDLQSPLQASAIQNLMATGTLQIGSQSQTKYSTVIEAIKGQAACDARFREARRRLGVRIGGGLIDNQLITLLKEHGYHYSQEQLKDTFHPDRDEVCIPGEGGRGAIRELVARFIQADQHFKCCIEGRFNRQQSQQFYQKLSFGLGQARLSDLVRFVNIEAGTFYRPRELAQLFRRLAGGGHALKREQAIRILTR